MMKTLLDVNKDRLLTLAGITYKLLEVAGHGGSSIVYKTRKEGKSEDYYMIKEFYPYDLVSGRETDGSVRFPEDKKDVVERLKSRALRESEIVNELRHGDENNNPWFLQYSEPIPANNTLYTIIATEAGEMLSEKISGGYFQSRKFTDICDCVLMILKALEPIHNIGYLHLDVSPDNIHFSNLNIMRLIDYNSAFCLSGHVGEIIPSFKEGYSAPELKKITVTKSPELSFATDLYSVAAIFCELLRGRPPEAKDNLILSRRFSEIEEGILKGTSELLIKNTKAFLIKNLFSIPEERLQSVTEMREKIEQLKNLSQEILLDNSPIRPNSHFVCRESEIESLDERLKNDNYVILEGIGGIGKTELAKKYAWDNRGKYDIVQFVTFRDSLLSTIALSLAFQNFDSAIYEKYDDDAVKYMYKDKLSWLKNKSGGMRILLIVDNYNVVADDNFAEFVSGEYKVIFTSKNKHNGSVLEIAEMKDIDEQMVLFRTYAPAKLSAEDEPVVREIIRLVHGHTMTVMLIAIAMQKSRKTPKEMLELLQTDLDPELRTKIAIDKVGISVDVREQVMYRHITRLFDMTQIRRKKNYSFIMVNMAIVPHTGVDIKTFYQWALSSGYKNKKSKGEDYTDLNRLIDSRWIQYDEETQRVSLHPVISDVANRELNPDSMKCGALINCLINHAKECCGKTYVEQSAAIEIVELACKRITDDTKLTSELYYLCGTINDDLEQYFLAAERLEKALKIKQQVLGDEHAETAKAYNHVGLAYSHLEKYGKSLDYFNKALSIYCKIYGENHSYSATIYFNIGVAYIKLGEYDKALEYNKKALVIRRNIHGENHLDVAESYINIGTLHRRLNKYDEALEFNEKALKITEKNSDMKSSYFAAGAYFNMGVIYKEMSLYEKALEHFNKSLSIDKIIFGEEHPDTARTYGVIGVVCRLKGKYEKALEYDEKALKILIGIFGENHSDVAHIYSNIGVVYRLKEKYEKALEYDEKALEILIGIFGENHLDIAISYNNIGAVYYELGQSDNALEYKKKALEIYIKFYPKNHPDVKLVQDHIDEIQSNI